MVEHNELIPVLAGLRPLNIPTILIPNFVVRTRSIGIFIMLVLSSLAKDDPSSN